MSSITARLSGNGNFRHGIHPDDRKAFSADAKIEVLPAPAEVAIPLLQHAGSPAEVTVKPREQVSMGQVIAKATGFISAAIHASINGTVGAYGVATLPNGRHVKTVTIKAGPDQLAGQPLWDDIYGGDWPTSGLDKYEFQQIIEAISSAGLVGLGGAAFPTHVKLLKNPKKPIDTLLVNGCECEPFLTADYRLMLEAPRPIVAGALLAAHAIDARQVAIVIEDNKPLAAEAMRKACEGTHIEVKVVHTKYPMGGERQLVPAALKRKIPTGGLPLDVGVVVINVATAAAVARAVLRGKPLTHRVVTVTGRGIKQPKNVLTPIGASYADLAAFCGGVQESAARFVAGGPMMGFAIGSLNVPVTKGTSGLTILTAGDVERTEETQCIRCGRCVDVCPLKLVPTRMAMAARNKDWPLARRYHLMACCECACCSYICPASLPLTQLIRLGKAELPRL